MARILLPETSEAIPSPLPSPPSVERSHDYTLFALSLTALAILVCISFAARSCNRRNRTSAAAVRPTNPSVTRDIEKQIIEQLKAIQVTNYSGNSTADHEYSECCVICLGDFAADEEVKVLPRCKHMYHQDCIDAWLYLRSLQCPVCREHAVVIPLKGTAKT